LIRRKEEGRWMRVGEGNGGWIDIFCLEEGTKSKDTLSGLTTFHSSKICKKYEITGIFFLPNIKRIILGGTLNNFDHLPNLKKIKDNNFDHTKFEENKR
jgi:hypothetical protein